MTQKEFSPYRYYPEKIGFLVILIISVVLSKKGFTYDEPYYLSNLDLLEKYGLSDLYLYNLLGPAGPTYSVLHYILSPITHVEFVQVRLVNFLLFICCCWLLNKALKQVELRSIGFIAVCIPMTAVCVGMALTEMPAVFFLTAAVYFITIKASGYLSIVYRIISGLLFSFAILGRQPLLLCIPFFVYLNGFSRSKLIENSGFLTAALILPVYCFMVWKGIIPTQGNIAEKGGLVIIHFIFALGYALICFLLLAPGFLKLPFKIKWWMPVFLSLIMFVIAIVTGQQYPILNTLAARILPALLLQYYPYLGFALLTLAGMYLVIVFFYRLYENRNNRIYVFAVLCCSAILFSSLAIRHQFSSRYVFQALPFMIIMAAPYVKQTRPNLALRCFGLMLGIASLITYVLL